MNLINWIWHGEGRKALEAFSDIMVEKWLKEITFAWPVVPELEGTLESSGELIK